MNKHPRRILLWLGVCASILAGIILSGWLYTTAQLTVARSKGIYPSPEVGMRGLIAAGYVGIQKIEIVRAGINAFDGSDPHVWYVIAKVWADQRADGNAVGNGQKDYDVPGSYFIRVKEGWVHMPEGAFPELIGFWMKVFGMVIDG